MAPYRDAQTLGIYLHCAKLREVDTTHVLEDVMRRGASAVVGPPRWVSNRCAALTAAAFKQLLTAASAPLEILACIYVAIAMPSMDTS